MKRALITGITGQDGSYLSEFLLEKRYQVHGIIRRVALEDPVHRLWRLNHILDKITLHSASLENYASIFNVIEKVKPDECYHLASQSFVSYSFDDAFSTLNTNINRTLFVLSAIKERVPDCKFISRQLPYTSDLTNDYLFNSVFDDDSVVESIIPHLSKK